MTDIGGERKAAAQNSVAAGSEAVLASASVAAKVRRRGCRARNGLAYGGSGRRAHWRRRAAGGGATRWRDRHRRERTRQRRDGRARGAGRGSMGACVAVAALTATQAAKCEAESAVKRPPAVPAAAVAEDRPAAPCVLAATSTATASPALIAAGEAPLVVGDSVRGARALVVVFTCFGRYPRPASQQRWRMRRAAARAATAAAAGRASPAPRVPWRRASARTPRQPRSFHPRQCLRPVTAARPRFAFASTRTAGGALQIRPCD